MQVGWMSFRTEGCNTTKTYTKATSYIFTEQDGLCGNQCYRRELLTMGTMVPETC